MTKTTAHRYDLAFWILVLIHLVAIWFDLSLLLSVTKPLLMPLLIMLLLRPGVKTSVNALIPAGLFFSWLGDVFLLFESFNPLFFIAGLASFLVTHLSYSFYFLSVKSTAPSVLKKHPAYFLLVLCYGTALVCLLFPYLGQLRLPVVLYTVFICGMFLCSIHIYLKVSQPANRYYVSGALLFILSDSILALNKFYHPLPLAGFCIMLSYCAAQFFIAWGFTRVAGSGRWLVAN